MSVATQSGQHQDLVDALLADVAKYNTDPDRELLTKAFAFAEQAHEGQLRKSGEEFIRHPWAVAMICAELRLDDGTIASALLHDVVEDTATSGGDLRSEFGDEVAQLVEGVTKLTRIQFQTRSTVSWRGFISYFSGSM